MTLRSIILTAVGLLSTLMCRGADVVLTGPVDAAALNAVAASGQTIGTLDLSGAEIVAYDGPRLVANLTHSPAGVLPAYVLSGLHASRILLPSGLTAIADGALMGSDIEEVTIPASCDSIGRGAFASCTRLKSVTIPATARRLGTHIFARCTALSSATVMAPVVPASTFAGCTALSTLTLGPKVKTIGADAFNECRSLTSVGFPTGLTGIGAGAFGHSGLRDVDLSVCHSLTSIGSEAFAYCPALTSASLPASATHIGTGLFFDSTSLADVTLPTSLTTIPALTLKGTAGPRYATDLIHEGVDSIGALALAGMDATRYLTLPSTLSHIADEGLAGMTSLSTLDVSPLEQVPALGADVFDGIDQPKVTLYTSEDMADIFMAAPQWREFKISSSETTLDQNITPGKGTVRVRFDGTLLRAASEYGIASARLYDLSGHLVGSATPAVPAAEVTIETSAQASPLFILTVTLADGAETSVKLVR
ncbi:MAG: leucine-rich repeat domain-containing protein [Duncaniella sp.]|nr:leucine-rich repeat domain-containing protein [Duncaniella sp.]